MPVHPEILKKAALRNVLKGCDKPPGQLRADELPPMAVSWTSTERLPVGTWKAQQPGYRRGLSPCISHCPVGNNVEGFISRFREGDEEGAAAVLAGETPFPSVCGRVCYHPCEDGCNRIHLDGAVSIRAIERYLGGLPFFSNKNVWTPAREASGKKVAVVGSGPSGLSCAWALLLLGHQVTVLDRAEKPGGLLFYGIPSYRLPKDVLESEISRLERLGVRFLMSQEVGKTKKLPDLRDSYNAVFVAAGAVQSRLVKLENDDGKRCFAALDFLAKIAAGKKPEVGRNCIIIGGGNSAIDAARSARRLGAEVTILYRRSRAEMPAYDQEIKNALSEGVELYELAVPVALGLKKEELVGLRCLQTRLGDPDESGRSSPYPIPGSDFVLKADTIINAAGEMVNIEALTGDPVFREALSKLSPWGESGVEGVFAGGDFSGRERTVAHAIGSGKRTAMAIDRYLTGRRSDPLEKYTFGGGPASLAAYLEFDKSDIPVGEVGEILYEDTNPAYFTRNERIAIQRLHSVDRTGDFSEIENTLISEQALKAAERCFSCGRCTHCGLCLLFCPEGAITIDPVTGDYSIIDSHCKGCGICVEECPRSAIEMGPVR